MGVFIADGTFNIVQRAPSNDFLNFVKQIFTLMFVMKKGSSYRDPEFDGKMVGYRASATHRRQLETLAKKKKIKISDIVRQAVDKTLLDAGITDPTEN